MTRPAKRRVLGRRSIDLTEADYLVMCEATNILTDGFWDDPEEPGHEENTVRWADLMLRVRRSFAKGRKQ